MNDFNRNGNGSKKKWTYEEVRDMSKLNQEKEYCYNGNCEKELTTPDTLYCSQECGLEGERCYGE